MNSPKLIRVLMVITGIAFVYCVTALIGLKVLPAPHSSTDYLVIGGIATFISMVILFIVLISGFTRQPDVFYKVKKKDEPNESA